MPTRNGGGAVVLTTEPALLPGSIRGVAPSSRLPGRRQPGAARAGLPDLSRMGGVCGQAHARSRAVVARHGRRRDAASSPQETPAWHPHGLLDDEPAMASCRAIRMRPRVFRTYLNSNGSLVERDLLPGGCINFFETTITADLVFHAENRIHSRLYHAPYWKKLQLHLPVKEWDEPQPVSFQIREALSNRYAPPARFRIRLRTYRCGSDTPLATPGTRPSFGSSTRRRSASRTRRRAPSARRA